MATVYHGPKRMAHMGIWQDAPANTLEAYKSAVESGAEGIEMDIQMSKDGEIICVHNSDPDFYTDGAVKEKFRDMTLEEIKKIELPYRNHTLAEQPPVPWTERAGGTPVQLTPEQESRVAHLITFPEFDAWLSTRTEDVTVEIEFKRTGMIQRMNEIVSKSPNAGHYIFFSGDKEVLAEMQQFYRDNKKPEGLRLGANIRFLNEMTWPFIESSDLYEVGLNNEAFTKEDVDKLAGMGIKVFSNLGDYESWWSQLAPLGVEAFKTNYVKAYTAFITK